PRQLRLDIHVNVLEFHLELKRACFDLSPDFAQPIHDLLPFGFGEQPGGFQCSRVRDGAFDIMAPQTPVEADRLAIAEQKVSGWFGESAVPHGSDETEKRCACSSRKLG